MKTDYLNPIHRGADPFILLYDNNYYLYATNAADGFKVSASSDLVNWEDKGYCLKKGDCFSGKTFIYSIFDSLFGFGIDRTGVLSGFFCKGGFCSDLYGLFDQFSSICGCFRFSDE